MKTLTISFLVITLITSCGNKIEKDNNPMKQVFNESQNKAAKEKSQAIKTEMQMYLNHAKECKTEYEVQSYIDSLPYMRQNTISQYGSEENWNKELEWLKTNGAKSISISSNGLPLFDRTKIGKSPYETH